MNRYGFLTLAGLAGVIYTVCHFWFGIEVITLFFLLLSKFSAFIKGLAAKLTWSFIASWAVTFSKSAVFKFLLSIPIAFGLNVLMVALFNSKERQERKAKKAARREKWIVRYKSVRARFDTWFGVNGALAFVISLVFALLTLVASFYFIGTEFFLWIGRIGWFSSIGAWVRSLFGEAIGMTRSALYRVPWAGQLLLVCAKFWRERVVACIPRVEYRRRKLVKDSLRKARSARKHSLGVYRRATLARMEQRAAKRAQWRRVQRKRVRRHYYGVITSTSVTIAAEARSMIATTAEAAEAYQADLIAARLAADVLDAHANE